VGNPADHRVRVVARVAVFNPDGEVLFCTTRGGDGWVLPGGTVEPGESLREAAAREAREEVGLAVEVESLLFVQEFVPKGQGETVYEIAFRARTAARGPDSYRHLDAEGPVREVRWFSREALRALQAAVFPAGARTGLWDGMADAYLGVVSG
jgi:8-oxo-dGTP diphosphatase